MNKFVKVLSIVMACSAMSISALSFHVPENPVEREVWFNEPWLVQSYVDTEVEDVVVAKPVVKQEVEKPVIQHVEPKYVNAFPEGTPSMLAPYAFDEKSDENSIVVQGRPLTRYEVLCLGAAVGVFVGVALTASYYSAAA